MLSPIRPEPRLPTMASLILLLSLGVFLSNHETHVERKNTEQYSALIDAAVSVYAATPLGQTRDIQAPKLVQQNSAARKGTVLHSGATDTFSLSVAAPNREECEALATLKDARVTRAVVNGTVLREGARMPSGYALLQACANHASTVTLELQPRAER